MSDDAEVRLLAEVAAEFPLIRQAIEAELAGDYRLAAELQSRDREQALSSMIRGIQRNFR